MNKNENIKQILDIRYSFILQAPAGSGKTELLARRYLSLFSQTANPKSILAITFTKKAAHEMKERILSYCGNRTLDAEMEGIMVAVKEKERDLGQYIVDIIDELSIQTIDAFAKEVVYKHKAMPFHLSPSTPILYHKAATKLMLHLSSLPCKESVIFLMQTLDLTEKDLIDLIAEILKDRQSIQPFLKKNLAHYLPNIYHYMHALYLHQVEKEMPHLMYAARTYCTHLPLEEMVCQLPQIFLTKQNQWRKTQDKKLCLPHVYEYLKKTLNYTDHELKILASMKRLPPKHIHLEMVEHLQAVLNTAIQILEDCFKEYQQCDLIEINAQMHHLLSSSHPSSALLSLDNQIQHILVDEFQDVSLSQFDLITQLIEGWGPHDGRTLFLIGDPMQSIYNFRKAKPILFKQIEQFGVQHLPIHSQYLYKNFRSTPGLVNWCNEVFSKQPHQAFIPSVSAYDTTPTEDVKFYFSPYRENQCHAIAQIIALHPNQSIAILARKKRDLQFIMQGLRALNIPCQNNIMPFSEDSCIYNLLIITRLCIDYGDEIAWYALLRSTLCGATLFEIEAIRSKQKNLLFPLWFLKQSWIAEDKLYSCLNMVQYILETHEKEWIVDRIYNVWNSLGGVAETEIQQANIFLFFQTIEEHIQLYHRLDISQLKQAWKNIQTKESKNLVQCMTIHGAKGLQFDVVILPDANKRPQESKKKGLLDVQEYWIGDHHTLYFPVFNIKDNEFLTNKMAQDKEEESIRLYYVAMTRAKKKLYLTAAIKADNKINPQSILSILQDQLPEKDLIQEAIEKQGYYVDFPYEPLNIDQEKAQTPWVYLKKTKAKHVPIQKQWHVASYTAYQKNVFGTAIHRSMYFYATHQSLPPQHLLSDWLQMLGCSHATLPQMIASIQQCLERITQDAIGKWIIQANNEAYAEFELTGLINQKYTTCIIDRTFVDQGKRWIIDYKTNHQDFLNKKQSWSKQLEQYKQIFSAYDDSHPIQLGVYILTTCDWHIF